MLTGARYFTTTKRKNSREILRQCRHISKGNANKPFPDHSFQMFASDESIRLFRSIVDPWYESLKNPPESQRQVLWGLAKEYAKTQYGKDHHVSSIKEIEDLRANFPMIDYKALRPYLTEVSKGNYGTILPEPLLSWVMTRGSTGPAKVLPATKTHLEQIFTCGARALVNHALRMKDSAFFAGRILNLNFPSKVHTIVVNGQPMTYGYSSGTYARLNPVFSRLSLLPRQESIDALGSGITKLDWGKRFELAYKEGINENVTAAMGVTPVILAFARYIAKRHRKKPKELWNVKALFCTSVHKIQSKYARLLRGLYGNVPVVEIYSATEGVFAQQLDDLPYVTPNYDKYLFEVETGHGTKMLYELRRGEWGKLVVSSCMFPRYSIGDVIESAGHNYFRIVGRWNTSTLLEHQLYRLLFGWLT